MKAVESSSPDTLLPWLHMKPIVDFLEAMGNEVVEDWTQGRESCILTMKYRIDHAALESEFLLPSNIYYNPEYDTVVDYFGWIEIRGGRANRAKE